MGRNAYFKFEEKPDGLYMNIYPAIDGGNPIAMEDVIFVLDRKNIPNVDLVAIRGEIAKNEEASIRIANNGIFSKGEWNDIKVSRDGMLVVARFFPPFVGGELLTKDDILKDLQFKKIRFGISESAIDTFLKERDYGKQYIIAQGRKAVEGKDAVLEYLFDTNKKAMPKLLEDGTVDFHNLDNITHVKAGDVVARITKEVEGVAGTDVYGNNLKPKQVAKKIFRYGRDLEVSEDGLELISKISGHITLDGDRISVSDTYTVPADVNVSTGNIDYDGGVVVTGNVLSGFSIKATGDVEVRGIVENAYIEAGGNIIIGRGMQGMQSGILKAGGNIVAKFIENARSVEAGESVKVGAIIQSNVSSGQDVIVEGKNGIIIGGKIVARHMIQAKSIGTEMGTNTTLVVGVKPELKMRAEELKKNIVKYNEDIEKLSTIINTLVKKAEGGSLDKTKLELLKKTKESHDAIVNSLSEACEEYSKIKEQVVEAPDACIKVSGTMFAGTRILFGDTEFTVKDKTSYCQYKKVDSEIKSYSL